MKIAPPRTRRVATKMKAVIQPSFVASLPLGVFRLPPDLWMLSLRRNDGTREIRKIRGDLFKARARRDDLMKTGRYTMAWLMEAREDIHRKHKTKLAAFDDGNRRLA